MVKYYCDCCGRPFQKNQLYTKSTTDLLDGLVLDSSLPEEFEICDTCLSSLSQSVHAAIAKACNQIPREGSNCK